MIKILLKHALLTLTLFFIVTSYTFAQSKDSIADTTKAWNLAGTGTINFSQVSLSNWAAGGRNSISVLGISNVSATYAKGDNTWDNFLDITYGTLKLESQRLQKSDDKFELNTKYGHRASERWFYSAQLNLKTQLTPTYTPSRDTMLSDFFAPAFILASVGMDYKPSKRLSVFISPFTGKFTVVKDQQLADAGAFGVKPALIDIEGNRITGTGQHFRKEFGGYVNVRYKEEIMQNIIFQSKLDLFSNYLHNPQNVDLNWENLVNFKVNKLISASLFLHMIYDDDINIAVDKSGDGTPDSKGPRLQLKETLGIGISYTFK